MNRLIYKNDFKLYELFVGLTVTIMITCDTLVYKTFDFYSVKITASGIIFSLCYLLSAVTTEVYGYKLGTRIVWIIVLCQSFFVILVNLCSIYQVDNNHISETYQSLFGEFWRVMLGTWISVPASYFCNGYIISRLKIYFKGRLFLVRYMLSAMIAQGILLITAYPISLSSKYSFFELINIISTTWSYKVIMSTLLLPIGILLARKVKKIEKIDTFDYNISYNPFNVFKQSSENESNTAH